MFAALLQTHTSRNRAKLEINIGNIFSQSLGGQNRIEGFGRRRET